MKGIRATPCTFARFGSSSPYILAIMQVESTRTSLEEGLGLYGLTDSELFW